MTAQAPFLSNALTALTATHDPEAVLRAAETLAVPELADRCTVELGAGLGSGLAVPLALGDRVIGSMTFTMEDGTRTFDVAAANLLAGWTVLAYENARLYQESVRAAKNLELVLEHTSEGIYGLDPEGRCTFINGTAASILGYRATDLLREIMHDRMHYRTPDGELYPIAECPICRALHGGRGCRLDEEVFFRADGSCFPVDYSSYPVDGGAVVTFTDISARKRAEAALRESEARYRGLFEHVSEGLYQTSPHGELLAANPALIALLGYETEHDIRALDVTDLYVEPEQRRKRTEELEREGVLRNATLRLKRKDGSEITVIENARVVRNQQGEALFYEGMLRLQPR